MAKPAPDLYSLLGLPRDASAEDIRTAYRKLARDNHPDLHPGDAAAEKRFKEIAAANEILSDPVKRKLYDEFGADALRAGFDPEKARAFHQWGGGGGGAGVEVDLSELLANLFAGGGPFGGGRFGGSVVDLGGGHGRGRRARGEDIVVRVDLDLKDAIQGTEIELQAPLPPSPEGPRSNLLKVRIPPGTDNGTRLRVPGKGAPGVRGGKPGDLYVETHLRRHPFFRREGLDLHLDLPVTLSEAWLGANVEVPTPDGNVKLKIPERAKSGTRLRLRGKGVARGDEHGDMFVRIEVQLPDSDDPALAEFLRVTDGLYSRPVRDDLRL